MPSASDRGIALGRLLNSMIGWDICSRNVLLISDTFLYADHAIPDGHQRRQAAEKFGISPADVQVNEVVRWNRKWLW